MSHGPSLCHQILDILAHLQGQKSSPCRQWTLTNTLVSLAGDTKAMSSRCCWDHCPALLGSFVTCGMAKVPVSLDGLDVLVWLHSFAFQTLFPWQAAVPRPQLPGPAVLPHQGHWERGWERQEISQCCSMVWAFCHPCPTYTRALQRGSLHVCLVPHSTIKTKASSQ